MSSNIIFNKRTIAALFAIVIASSLIVISDFVASASAYAAKKVKQHEFGMTLAVPFSGLASVLDKDKSISRTSHSANAGDSDWTIGSANSIPTNEMSVWREIYNT
jgi:hypothetical protein